MLWFPICLFGVFCTSVDMYTTADLLLLNSPACTPSRSLRKTLFRLKLWLPRDQRTGTVIDNVLRTAQGPDENNSVLSTNKMAFAVWNACSIGNKFSSVSEFITDHHLDIFSVTESWHGGSDDVAVLRSTPAGYRALDVPRPCSIPLRTKQHNGGGVITYIRDHLAAKKLDVIVGQKTFEYICTSISTRSGPVVVVTIYRPPGDPSLEFFREFSSLLEALATFNSQLIIAGDLNIHFEQLSSPYTVRMMQLLASFALVQHVNQPTHKHGGILDAVITRTDCSITDLTVDPPSLSDHRPVICMIPFACPPRPTFIARQVRGWKKLDREGFRSSLLAGALCREESFYKDMTADQLFQLYETTLREGLDSFIPLHKVTTRQCASTPWFDAECRQMKRRVRMLERRYRRSGDLVDRLAWITEVRKKHAFFKNKEDEYWESTITANSKNPKKLWRSVSTILGGSSKRSSSAPSFSASDFLKFMEDKVDAVRASTADSPPPVFTEAESSFSSFTACTQGEISAFIKASANKTCDLDPVPTFLVKENLETLLPFLTRMCNASILEGSLPSSQKEAIVTPALKKFNLNPGEVSNYRPISNLTFMSKIVERVVFCQLSAYLVANNLLPTFQSGFRRAHSTESAVLRVMSDIYSAIDKGQVALLSLLDVTAAFDTVDHGIMLKRLSRSYGMTDSVYSWFESFVTGRHLSVRLGDTTSQSVAVRSGLPQGSVLGPILYVLYTTDIAALVESLGFRVHLYADDTQIYGFCASLDSTGFAIRMNQAIDIIGAWMSSNRLRLNSGKTQFIWFGTRQRLENRDLPQLVAVSASFASNDSVRNLGVLLDPQLTLEDHITKLSQSCFFQLRRLRSVRHSLTKKSMLTLIHAFVCSRLDYCNSVFYGAAASQLDRLQSILNAAARLVLGIPKYGHISAAIHDDLHWLPVQFRINFKLCLLVRNCLANAAPAYLTEFVIRVSACAGRGHLRSAAKNDLVVPRCRTERFGRRGFSVSGPCLWNQLPIAIRLLMDKPETFKHALKTHYMQQSRQHF